MSSEKETPQSVSEASRIPVQEMQEHPGQQFEMKPQPLAHQIPCEDDKLREYQAAGKLRGKIALITGGIGRATAVLYAMEKAQGIAIVHLPKEEQVSYYLNIDYINMNSLNLNTHLYIGCKGHKESSSEMW